MMMLLCVSLFAQNRSNNEALRLASDFLTSECGEVGTLSVSLKPKMAVPGSNTSQNSSFIVNDEDNGRFVIVSADERMLPILGYSENGKLDLDNAPDGLLFMLESYEKQYQFLMQHPDEVTAKNLAVTTPVEPLIKTAWGQSTPYNDDCPAYGGDKCVTGCVATAMAQVMNYYQYPAQCQGSFSYTTNTLNLPQALNYDEITFDWSKMLNEFYSSSPSANKLEIAKLMHACGVSVSMDYNTNGSGGSASYDNNIPYAMMNFFGYGSDICFKDKEYYSPTEWEKMIIDELTASHPVFYGGSGSKGGHQFILDGVDGNGRFHFNFGWYGLGDGYFALDAITPKPNGTTYDFNDNQSMVCKVYPTSFGEEKEDVFYSYSLEFSTGELTLNNVFNFSYGAYCYSNNSTYQEDGLGGFTGELGFGIFDNEFNFINTLTSTNLSDLDCSLGQGRYGTLYLSSSEFEDGQTYFFAIYAKGADSTSPTLVRSSWGSVQCYRAEVKDGNITISPKYDLAPDYNLKVSDAGVSSMYLDHAVTIPKNKNLLGVFYVNEINGQVMNLKRVRNVLPAYTGVIIMANTGTIAFPACTEEVEPITDNLLLGTTEPLAREDVDGTVYTLGRGVNSGYVGFHKYTGSTIPANKCYYVRTGDSSVNSFSFNADDATAIEKVTDQNDTPTIIYDLQGRRVTTPTHGIYIINGKKVLVR